MEPNKTVVKTYGIDVYSARLRITNNIMKLKNDPEGKGLNPKEKNPCCWLTGVNGKFEAQVYLPNTCYQSACHESVHVAFDLLHRIGHSPSVNEQEPLAWLTDYVFSCCLDYFKHLERINKTGEQP